MSNYLKTKIAEAIAPSLVATIDKAADGFIQLITIIMTDIKEEVANKESVKDAVNAINEYAKEYGIVLPEGDADADNS